jgi:tRNA-binding protein
MGENINIKDFASLDIRVGTILAAAPAPDAKVPAYHLEIDFGALGTRRSSARITDHYRPEELVGSQILAVVNFPPKQIGHFRSEVLVLGGYEPDGSVKLLRPDKPITNGARVR